MTKRRFFVYIMTNEKRTLYVGMTNDLERRVWEHKSKQVDGFTSRYNITFLAYFAEFNDPRDAIEYEKKLKSWRREKKTALIESENPNWLDLASDWF